MLAEREIVQRFLDTHLQVHPDVVSYILERNDPTLIDRIIAETPGGTLVVLPRRIPDLRAERDGTRFLADPDLEIVAGSEGSSSSAGRFEDSLHFFRDRYNKLSAIIRARHTAMPIEALIKSPSRYQEHECTLTGMVVDARGTAKGHRIIELEDPTAAIHVLFNRSRDSVFLEGERIVPDEIIGVRGKLAKDGGLFFAEQLFRPDIPLNHAPFTSDREGKAVFISDVHVGSNTFLEDHWNRFADWLQDSEVAYMLIAGDLVDGIGVYPGQEHELVIRNIYEQYEVFAEMLRDLPGRMKIVIGPGNHDVVRGAEPQPVIPKAFAGKFPGNCVLVENPCQVNLQGIRVQMYHGRSIDDLISLIPGASYTRADEIMVEMLKRRHLAPSYGNRTPIAAAKEDRLIIDPVPEILHTGHVHICGMGKYRGVLCINTGTWQGQTTFQKQMNIHPTPAIATVVDLATLEPQVIDFST